jgi:acyl carrier protein
MIYPSFFKVERIAKMTGIEDQVITFISKQLKVENVSPEMHFMEDLGIDSISLIELVLEIGQEFGIVITDGHLNRTRTVRDIIVSVEKHASK